MFLLYKKGDFVYCSGKIIGPLFVVESFLKTEIPD